jgi:fucose 4-O-acetylase-like acetyltransferase
VRPAGFERLKYESLNAVLDIDCIVTAEVAFFDRLGRLSLSAMPGAWWIPCLFIFSVILWLLVSLRPRRERILHWLRRAILIEAAYLVASYIMIHANFSLIESLFGGLLAAFVVERMIPGRKWHFSTSARRRKVAEQDLQTGRKFNRTKNERDRVVPFSKGNIRN